MIEDLFMKLYNVNFDHSYCAPARINLIGEHIDYNGGHVVPCCINLYTTCLVKKREDDIVYFSSKSFGNQIIKRNLNDLSFDICCGWANYPIGVCKILLDHGYKIHGFNVLYDSNIPLASGLSSSASILDLTTFFINDIFNLKLTRKEIAFISQEAEVKYNKLNCGIMDEAIISLGKKDNCLLLDTSNFNYKYIPFNMNGYKIIVMKTNKERKLTESKYNERVKECNTSLAILKKYYKVDNLCSLSVNDLEKIKLILKDDILYKRVKHCITEEKRVIDFCESLKINDINKCGNLLKESHESLKNYYEVTGIHLDTIVELSNNTKGCLGARMTGAGFGGCAIAIVEDQYVNEFCENVSKKYYEKLNIKPELISCNIVDGVKKL